MRTKILALTLLGGIAFPAVSDAWQLSDSCPASHQKLADGTCELVTLYDFYASPDQHGGVQAELPELLSGRFTPQQIDLGRILFFDPILSAEKDMSCASCHQPERGLSDGRKRSLGATTGAARTELPRSTPSLWNVGFQPRFMWDGRAETLEEQALLPLFSEVEMGNTKEGVETALLDNPAYVQLFDDAFEAPPSVERVGTALAAFQASLVSFNSRYDRYAHGDASALSPQEVLGMNAFRGFVGRCSQCHIPPLFTDSELSVVGAPENDLGHADLGAGALNTDEPALLGAFKVPTLRNITRTAPYFHSGQFETLDEVVDFYNNDRGHMAPEGQDLKIHWHVHMTKGPQLSKEDMVNIVAFLSALEDETLMPTVPEKLPSGLTPVPGL
ncbi:di-heme cytochrome c peroxidase [Ruegeria sp. 2012CJ41-6]|uniref:Di-heme cytochrome c peroxidase n=1 Tax=Ruegeria spongiae TaxID=2942209 RepID=A0ABT0PY06_9RHOB|nr:cytochrome c peroxidase [Ruegeria spongiae]MCL6282456.1 di-heme cytochrome c peroxidase [Ruegeria spongiae]